MLLSGLVIQLGYRNFLLNKDHFTQTVDFSKKLTDSNTYQHPPDEDDEEQTAPVNNYQPPTFVYRDNNQFDHVYVDRISKRKKTNDKSNRSLHVRADVRVDGYVNAKTIQLNGAPIVSYNNSTNTIEFQ